MAAVATNHLILIKWHHIGEIYRFSYVDTVQERFAELLTKMRELQADFTGSLAWKDNEGDLINLASDTELNEAINATGAGKALCIFTKRDGSGSDTPPPRYSLVVGSDMDESGEDDDGDSKCRGCVKDLRLELVFFGCTNEECDISICLCNVCYAEDHHPHEHPLSRITLIEASEESTVLKSMERPATCNLCSKAIRSVLYNCDYCINFDLCQVCMDRHGHRHDNNHVITCYSFLDTVDFPYSRPDFDTIEIHQLNGKINYPGIQGLSAEQIAAYRRSSAAQQQTQHDRQIGGILNRLINRISSVFSIESPNISRSKFYVEHDAYNQGNDDNEDNEDNNEAI